MEILLICGVVCFVLVINILFVLFLVWDLNILENMLCKFNFKFLLFFVSLFIDFVVLLNRCLVFFVNWIWFVVLFLILGFVFEYVCDVILLFEFDNVCWREWL